MAKSKRIISTNFLYLPIKVTLRQNEFDLKAFLDTGFSGILILPPNMVTNGKPPDLYSNCQLANDSIIRIPTYIGSVKFWNKKFSNITILAMGDEPIIGREVIKYFRITLDHGKKIILEQ